MSPALEAPRWPDAKGVGNIKKHSTQHIGRNKVSRCIAKKIIFGEESENGGEQEAAIPLTGGLVRSVMVRVQLFFTAFCRRGRHGCFFVLGFVFFIRSGANSQRRSWFPLNEQEDRWCGVKVERAQAKQRAAFAHNVAGPTREGSHSERAAHALLS